MSPMTIKLDSDSIPQERRVLPRVLIAVMKEDLRAQLTEGLLLEGYSIALIANVDQLAAKINIEEPDCVIFDVFHGAVEAISEMRRIGSEKEIEQTPGVLALVPPRAEGKSKRVKDRADEYALMPFTLAELKDRMESAVGRVRTRAKAVIVVDDPLNEEAIVIDRASRSVTVGERKVELTQMEFDLLVALAVEPRQVVKKSDLLAEVWGYVCPPSTRTLEAHASRLRRKLDPEDSSKWVHSTRGYGFSLCRAN